MHFSMHFIFFWKCVHFSALYFHHKCVEQLWLIDASRHYVFGYLLMDSLFLLVLSHSFGDLVLLVGQQKRHLTLKNLLLHPGRLSVVPSTLLKICRQIISACMHMCTCMDVDLCVPMYMSLFVNVIWPRNCCWYVADCNTVDITLVVTWTWCSTSCAFSVYDGHLTGNPGKCRTVAQWALGSVWKVTTATIYADISRLPLGASRIPG